MSRLGLAALAITALLSVIAGTAEAALPSRELPVYACDSASTSPNHKKTPFMAKVTAPRGWHLTGLNFAGGTTGAALWAQRGRVSGRTFTPPVLINVSAYRIQLMTGSALQQVRTDEGGEFALKQFGGFTSALLASNGAPSATILSAGWYSAHDRGITVGNSFAQGGTDFLIGPDPTDNTRYEYIKVQIDAQPNVNLTKQQNADTVTAVTRIARTMRLRALTDTTTAMQQLAGPDC